MAQPETNPESSLQLSDFSDLLSHFSLLPSAVLSPLFAIHHDQIPPISVTMENINYDDDDYESQRPSALSVSTSLNVLYSPSVVNNFELSTPAIVPSTAIIPAVEENDNRDYPAPDPKTFEILFIYDNKANHHAFSCRPSFFLINQETFFSDSANDIFVSSVEWCIREKSKQHFLIITFTVQEQQKECRVFILAEGLIPEEGIELKEGVVLLSEFGRSLKRVDCHDQRKGDSGKKQISDEVG
ncbi:hypothetical protein Clacol_004190 [Clathrus columnatus]|uniref:Uncharacterized protein n=1 Tax=Clathrus columnatus TaxID=1419009 RepID=A0AAV5AAM3_9AGAM|nr:hypothetical protein Clacol_004190 [Clathrus columnatus]